jgi:hypothetical protein
VPIGPLTKLGNQIGEEAFVQLGGAGYVAAAKAPALANQNRQQHALDDDRKGLGAEELRAQPRAG